MSRPIRARINLAALRHNLRVARELAAPARIWAVVKADAYGHGLDAVVEALAEEADGFALVEIDAAVALRESGVRQPLLLMEGCYRPEDWTLFAEHGLTAVLHAPWQIDSLVDAGLPVAPDVCLKLETGMHRLGLDAAQFSYAMRRLHRSGVARSVTLMSHFADADGNGGVADQLAVFEQLAAGMELPRTLANSAALLRYGEQFNRAGDWVRPGIMLYGASPCPHLRTAAECGLEPVMTLESELIAVKTIAAGDRVGYGGLFAAPRPMRIGIVACGYADGYPRHAPTGTPVLVSGLRTQVLGRVSMDKLCVDLSELPQAAIGEIATLWGRHDPSGAVLPADEVAGAAGTVAYELFCALAGRVGRCYVN